MGRVGSTKAPRRRASPFAISRRVFGLRAPGTCQNGSFVEAAGSGCFCPCQPSGQFALGAACDTCGVGNASAVRCGQLQRWGRGQARAGAVP